MHSENFYMHFLNLLYNFNLDNLNKSLQNVEAIDLIDHKNKIVIQVSSTSTKQKIESALNKDIIQNYTDYTFKFISISKDATSLRGKTYNNIHSIPFDPLKDIIDINSLLNEIISLEVNNQREVYQFIKDELGDEIDFIKLDSNLAVIINILAQESWDESAQEETIDSFEIERKINHNSLNFVKDIIDQYALFYTRVNNKYNEFDSMGKNKSFSVLSTIRKEYIKLKKDNTNSDDIFFQVSSNIHNKVLESANYKEIPIDELELCIDILIVDAFIRCKIFENPEGYKYVIA